MATADGRLLCCGGGVFALAFVAPLLWGQSPEASDATPAQAKTDAPASVTPSRPRDKIDKRAFGVFPNYRSADASSPFRPISAREKITIAVKDSFDWPLFFVAGGYAGLGQITNQNPSFGQGTKGYANRYVRLYADLAVGNLLTEGFMPSLLHEDPRYFRRGTGNVWRRTIYATSRILITRTDLGGTRFNFSETVGNAIGVGISNAYYPDTRTARQNVEKLTIQLATDAFSNVMKEFWPDVKQRLSRSHRNRTPATRTP